MTRGLPACAEFDARATRSDGTREFAACFTDALVAASCLHCQRQPDQHAGNKCLLDATSYEPYGPARTGELLRRKAVEWAALFEQLPRAPEI